MILFLHGGAYVRSFSEMHWRFAAKLVSETGFQVVACDYQILPGNYHQAQELIFTLYQKLRQDYPNKKILIVGDSAGAALGLALTMSLRDKNLPQPTKNLMLSPYLDVSMTNPAILEVAPFDPWLNPSALREAALQYAAGDDLMNPQLSPLYGDLRHLCPMMIIFGSHDILYPDGLKFKERCHQENVSLEFHLQPELIHVYPLFENLPESQKAWKLMLKFLLTDQ